MTSEAAGTRPIIFSIKSYPCMPKVGSHSIQGMAVHSGQTRKQCLQSPKTASSGLKMTSEAAGTRPFIFSIKSYPCMPKARSHSIQGMAGHSRQTRKQSLQSPKTASGGLKMTSEAAVTRPIIFKIKSYPCMPKAGSHSIQGMAGHSGQTRKQTNKQIPLCFISIDYNQCNLCWNEAL